jgi:hypothetical protein
MTEADWLQCGDPEVMLAFLKPRLSERKLPLYACASCRAVWHLFPDGLCRLAVETAERLADGLASEQEADRLVEELRDKSAPTSVLGRHAERAASLALSRDSTLAFAWSYATAVAEGDRIARRDLPRGIGRWVNLPIETGRRAWHTTHNPQAPFADLLREIVGNPFHDVRLAASVFATLDGFVVKLAQGIYEDRAFDRLPILADALEEAGCADESILTHLRTPSLHVRGCWALDVVLDRS